MRRRLLSTSLFLVTGGVLLQALLAGLFISGTAGARMTHIIVGAVRPYLAIIPAVAAWRRTTHGVKTRGFAWGATLALAALWVQEALGHMPFPIATIIHVPLGVLLFGLSTGANPYVAPAADPGSGARVIVVEVGEHYPTLLRPIQPETFERCFDHRPGTGRQPGPLVTRCRSLTVAKVDSIAFVVRRCFQCSGGKS